MNINMNIKNPSTDRPGSPSTISTKPSSSLLLNRAPPAPTITTTKESSHRSTEDHHENDDSDGDNDGYGAEICCSPKPQHKKHHCKQQQTPRSSSILRKTRFSPDANIISPRPSTGHRVKGLWSPSVMVYEENSGENYQPISSTSSSPSRIPMLPITPTPSPIETMRDETLVKVFCYLPLADLLRAGMVSRRWRHEIHKTGKGLQGEANARGIGIGNSKKGQRQRAVEGSSSSGNWETETASTNIEPIHLWEKVDATTFIQERYESFLGIAKERKLREQQQQQQREVEGQADKELQQALAQAQAAELQQEQAQDRHPVSIQSTTTAIGKKKRNGATKKKNTIKNPCLWARIQTGLALGSVLRSKTTITTTSKRERATQPFEIRSLVLRNIGDKLSSDNLDDFLPSSLLSSLKELTLEGFESLADTHVHVLLLTTLGCPNPFHNSKKMMMHPKNKSRSGKSKLEALALENCPRLTSKVLSSVAKTCSHERLMRLSVRGCANIDSIGSISDLLITKLVLPSERELLEQLPKPTTPLLDPPDLTAISPSTPSLSLASLFAPETPTAALLGKRASSSSLFALQRAPSVAAFKRAPVGFASLFAPPPLHRNAPARTTPSPTGVASLFAPPPQTKQNQPEPEEEDAPANKQPKAAVMDASLLEPPPPQRPLSQQQAPSTNIVSGGHSSLSSSSPPSKSSLAALFDLPGTSPTRLNNAESIRILPPMAMPSSQPTSSPKFPSPYSKGSGGTTSATTASKRYHRHRRSLSNGKLPFPPALLPMGDAHELFHKNSRDVIIPSTSGGIHCRSMVVGSLRALDIRGTAVTPSSLVDCLRALTHHNHSGADRSWCRVWFEALHVSSAETPAKIDESNDNRLELSNLRWTLEDLARLETLLAMDEMKRNGPSVGSSNSSREGVWYSASGASPK